MQWRPQPLVPEVSIPDATRDRFQQRFRFFESVVVQNSFSKCPNAHPVPIVTGASGAKIAGRVQARALLQAALAFAGLRLVG